MVTKTTPYGRLGNQIIRNLAVSMIAKKHDLFVDYCSIDLLEKLGINIHIGNNKHDNSKSLTDENFFTILEDNELTSNLEPNSNFFQTREITNFLYEYLHSDEIKTNIMNKNPFSDRYNANNDLFIHVRLSDAEKNNPGLNYYLKTIMLIQYDKLYLSTDDKSHSIITEITEKYPEAILLDYEEIETFQFSSTCKNIILSHGSFSAIIGYLSFFSKIYYPQYEDDKIWYGDMFSIEGWNKIDLPFENI
jgi:hypothetical protein